MGLHIFMLDNELMERFEGSYAPWGRMALICCLLLGWEMGVVDALPDTLTSRLFAFVAGGVIITSVHEELSVEEFGRFGWFAVGAAAYAVVLMLI
jgi:bacteriorhodopsin